MEPSRDFDHLAETISRRLASTFSRRSFLGGLGAGGVTMAAGGVGAASALLNADSASATHVGIPCSASNAVACENLAGWYQNSCPPCTCGCGWWTVCAPECTYRKVWSDCCSTDGCYCNSTNVHCYNGGSRASCYFYKTYPCGCGNGGSHIACRRWYCTGGGACNTQCS